MISTLEMYTQNPSNCDMIAPADSWSHTQLDIDHQQEQENALHP